VKLSLSFNGLSATYWLNNLLSYNIPIDIFYLGDVILPILVNSFQVFGIICIIPIAPTGLITVAFNPDSAIACALNYL
jgi:hypothetical protein